jgi:hypothetical protein
MRSRLFVGATVAGLLLVSGAASLWLGQDVSFDLLNYHFYVGYAFVEGRLALDLAPVGPASYVNPLLDAVHYLGITRLPPPLFGFLLGAVHGLNPALVFLIGLRLFGPGDDGRLLALLAGGLAGTGANAIALLGTTFGDTLASIPGLLALLLLLGREEAGEERIAPVSAARILWAFFLAGAATGLKLTMATYVVALAATLLLVLWHRRARTLGALLAVPGSILGFLATGGFWCLRLWRMFGNPIFPFANYFFRSPYFSDPEARDLRWAAVTLRDYLSPPLDMARGETHGILEMEFRDWRFLLVALALLSWLLLRLARRRPALPPAQGELLGYVLAGYLTWLGAFYYYRYAAALEFLAPLALFVLVRASLPRAALWVLVAISAVLPLVTSEGPGLWGRAPWPDRWFTVDVPAVGREPKSLVLVAGTGVSFVIPFFPPETRFLGLAHGGSAFFDRRIAAELARHQGPILLLSHPRQRFPTLRRFGLRVTEECAKVDSDHLARIRLCRVVRASS